MSYSSLKMNSLPSDFFAIQFSNVRLDNRLFKNCISKITHKVDLLLPDHKEKSTNNIGSRSQSTCECLPLWRVSREKEIAHVKAEGLEAFGDCAWGKAGCPRPGAWREKQCLGLREMREKKKSERLDSLQTERSKGCGLLLEEKTSPGNSQQGSRF